MTVVCQLYCKRPSCEEADLFGPSRKNEIARKGLARYLVPESGELANPVHGIELLVGSPGRALLEGKSLVMPNLIPKPPKDLNAKARGVNCCRGGAATDKMNMLMLAS